MKEKIIIFDTTLRDGEQSLKFSLNSKKKLKIALLLEKMNVDIIEAGFPISSPEDFKSIKKISKKIKNSTICSLARCIKKDIEIAAKAMKYSNNFRIHLFLGTSDIHIKSKLKKNFNEIIEMMQSSIKYAKKYTNNIEFSCEDAVRTKISNLCKFVEIAINSGANTINIPDTVGISCPSEFKKIIFTLKNKVPNIDKAILSAHCHNDLNMSVGNSISAIEAGVRQIEGTFTGIGERAGNTSLEDLIMAIKIKKNFYKKYKTNICYNKIYSTSKKISKICKFKISKNKSIIGKNAFSHSSGIHQDGILKNRKNYEILDPTIIGRKNCTFTLTARSGRAGIKNRMNFLGYNDNAYNLNKLYKKFLKFSDKHGKIKDYQLKKLAFSKKKNINNKKIELKSIKINIKKKEKNIFIKIFYNKKKKNIFIKKKKCFLKQIFKKILKISKINYKLKKYSFKTLYKKNIYLKYSKIILIYKKQKFCGTSNKKEFYLSYINSLIIAVNKIFKNESYI